MTGNYQLTDKIIDQMVDNLTAEDLDYEDTIEDTIEDWGSIIEDQRENEKRMRALRDLEKEMRENEERHRMLLREIEDDSARKEYIENLYQQGGKKGIEE